jgi:hypothetical protein
LWDREKEKWWEILSYVQNQDISDISEMEMIYLYSTVYICFGENELSFTGAFALSLCCNSIALHTYGFGFL